MEVTPNFTFIPHTWLSTSGEGKKSGGIDTTNKYSYINLGCAADLNINEKAMLVTDLGIQLNSGTQKDGPTKIKYDINSTPYLKLGLESALSRKITLRLGAVKKWVGYSYERSIGTTSLGRVETRTYLGAGFHPGNLEIDADVNPEFLTRGPYMLSGATGDLATQVSLKYYWGE